MSHLSNGTVNCLLPHMSFYRNTTVEFTTAHCSTGAATPVEYPHHYLLASPSDTLFPFSFILFALMEICLNYWQKSVLLTKEF